ncbi:uncharacterized protein [Magallana gigas]|uniref:uncharacterized protein n=1 Tax=Magallana gigas TaxID=29159 RepID=UPI00333EA576
MPKENYFGFDHCKDKKALAFSLFFYNKKAKRIFRWKTPLALTHHSSIVLPVDKLLVKRIFRWKTLLALTHHSSKALPTDKLLVKRIFRWKTLLEMTHHSSKALFVDRLLLKMIFRWKKLLELTHHSSIPLPVDKLLLFNTGEEDWWKTYYMPLFLQSRRRQWNYW